MKWLRLWTEWGHDPKVQSMPEHMQRRHIMLLCLRRQTDTTKLSDDDIAHYMRIDSSELVKTKELFVAKGFIDNGWEIVHWDDRQFPSDLSTPRVQKHREKQSETLQKRFGNAGDKNRTDKKKNIYSEQAEFIYSYYPRKIQKQHAIEKIIARLNAGANFNDLLAATVNYSDLVKNEKREAKFILHGRTFYGSKEPWQDYRHRKAKCISCGKLRLESNLDEARACKEGC